MMILFYLQAGDGPVRIGLADTNTIAARRTQWQQGNPEPLAIRCAYKARRSDLARIRGTHHEHRIRGDWYQPQVLDKPPDGLERVPIDTGLTAADHLRAITGGKT